MNLLNYWQRRSFFSIAALYYLLFLLLFFFAQRNKIPATPIVLMQILGMGMIVFFSFLYDKRSIFKTMLMIVIFQLVCYLGLRYFNVEYFDNPLGYKPTDALAYHQFGKHIELQFGNYIKYLLSKQLLLIDDLGFSVIVYLTYRLCGNPEIGIHLLVFFNVIAVSISSYYIYKLSSLLFDKESSCFVAFFWGTELYAVFTASIGLKENFMVMFIVIAMYFIMRVNKHILSKDVVYALLFSLPILLFRTAVFYMLICVLLYVLALRLPLVKRHFYVYISLIAIVSCIFAYQVIDELAIQHGYSYEMLEGFSDNTVKKQGKMVNVLNYIASLIGPLPNLVSGDIGKQNYITLYSFSSFCKAFYSFFFIYGILKAFRNKNIEMIGMTLFWFLNTFMLLFTLFAQNDRYQWPHIPFTILLAIYGLKCWNEKRHKIKWDWLYMIMASILIIVFNYR